MDLYIMRHADAVERSASDSARALTEHGMRQADRMGKLIASSVPGVLSIIASPYLRAQQTAEQVAAAVGNQAKITTDERLAPGLTMDDGSALVHEHGGESALLLVGHAPDVALLVAHFLGADPASIAMRKSAIACLQTERAGRGCATLHWLLHPGLLG